MKVSIHTRFVQPKCKVECQIYKDIEWDITQVALPHMGENVFIDGMSKTVTQINKAPQVKDAHSRPQTVIFLESVSLEEARHLLSKAWMVYDRETTN